MFGTDNFELGHVTDSNNKSHLESLTAPANLSHQMLTQVTTQQPIAQEATRGRGGSRGRGGRNGRNRGRGRYHAVEGKQESQGEQRSKDNGTVDATTAAMATTTLEEDPGEDLVCWICAEPVKYWSVSDCNHRTCHVCALRLRALYKKTDCAFCKVRSKPWLLCSVTICHPALLNFVRLLPGTSKIGYFYRLSGCRIQFIQAG